MEAAREDLASVPLLAGASPTHLDELMACLVPGHAPAGSVLAREGEPGATFFLLLAGRVEISVAGRAVRRRLAEAGPGSLLGELALLRHRSRSATITALSDCQFLEGGPPALQRLLAIPPVRQRVRRMVSTRLAEDLRPVPATLRDGAQVWLRPLLPADRRAYEAALRRLSPETIRRRFFSAAVPSARLVDYLLDLDYVDHFAWTALDARSGAGLATARFIRGAGHAEAEAAFTTVDGQQGRGLGTLLLGVLGVTAVEAGIEELTAYVLEENQAMRAVFAKAGARSRYDDPGVLLVTFQPGRAAALLDDGLRAAVAAAVHDIVTAASLALT